MRQYFFIENQECYIISEIIIIKFVKNQCYWDLLEKYQCFQLVLLTADLF